MFENKDLTLPHGRRQFQFEPFYCRGDRTHWVGRDGRHCRIGWCVVVLTGKFLRRQLEMNIKGPGNSGSVDNCPAQ